jgi:hypothetical protein
MLYQHKRTGAIIRKLLDSFSVERQRASTIYVYVDAQGEGSVTVGAIFDRDTNKFLEVFMPLYEPQTHITPMPKHEQQ